MSSTFRQWFEPVFKRSKKSSVVIEIDSSDDEEEHYMVPTPYIEVPSTRASPTDILSDPTSSETFDDIHATAMKEKTVADRRPMRPSRDILFRKRGSEERCSFTDQKSQCRFRAVNDTAFCYCHAHCASAPGCSFPAQDESGFSDSSSDSDSTSLSNDGSTTDDSDCVRPYTHREFIGLWKDCEVHFGHKTDEIENSKRVRGANQKMSPDDTDGQLKAQYGRLLPKAMKVCDPVDQRQCFKAY